MTTSRTPATNNLIDLGAVDVILDGATDLIEALHGKPLDETTAARSNRGTLLFRPHRTMRLATPGTPGVARYPGR